MMNTPRVAAAQYDIESHADWKSYEEKIALWLERIGEFNVSVSVFPEYGSMELASLLTSEIRSDVPATFSAMQRFLPDFVKLHQRLAQQYQMTIIGSSFPVNVSDGQYRNRSFVFFPDGTVDFQDKVVLTKFEQRWGIMLAATEQKVFNAPFGRFAIAICYDSEFPLVVRRLVEAGAGLVVVPSCTDTLAGYHRVRIGCQARALENQCYVVQSVTVGRAEWSPVVDENIGAAALYAPPDLGLPYNGVVTEGVLNNPQWIIFDIDKHALDRVRRHGHVRNHADWSKQIHGLADVVEVS